MVNRRAAPRRQDPTRHTRANPINAVDATTVSTYLRTRAPVLFRRQRRRPNPPARLEHLINILGPAFTQLLPQQSLVALRGTSSSIRRHTPISCMNLAFPGWAAGPGARYSPDMPNPNPWTDSLRIAGPRARCRRPDRMPLMRPCEGSQFRGSIVTAQNPTLGHDDQFMVCKPCADEAYVQFDHTRHPPWYIALCLQCSVQWRFHHTGPVPNIDCTCRTGYDPADRNLCSDCRFRFGERNFNNTMKRSCRTYLLSFPRDPAFPHLGGRGDIRRWVRHRYNNRNYCQCGLTYQELKATYPTLASGDRDLTQMATICLMCDGLTPAECTSLSLVLAKYHILYLLACLMINSSTHDSYP